jgi:hypothetical protein
MKIEFPIFVLQVTSARRSLRIRSATTEEDDDYDDE